MLNASQKINFGGSDLTKWLQRLLYENGFFFSTTSNIKTIQDIKEKYSYVAFDYELEIEKEKNTSDVDVLCNLPDGSSITISDERFTCPELLFKPSMNRFEFDGFDKVIYDSILKCKKEYQNDLFSNIVLSGGTTKINGFVERIEKEIINQAPPGMNVQFIAEQYREYLPWIGGSILASNEYFRQIAITRDDYNNR